MLQSHFPFSKLFFTTSILNWLAKSFFDLIYFYTLQAIARNLLDPLGFFSTPILWLKMWTQYYATRGTNKGSNYVSHRVNRSGSDSEARKQKPMWCKPFLNYSRISPNINWYQQIIALFLSVNCRHCSELHAAIHTRPFIFLCTVALRSLSLRRGATAAHHMILLLWQSEQKGKAFPTSSWVLLSCDDRWLLFWYQRTNFKGGNGVELTITSQTQIIPVSELDVWGCCAARGTKLAHGEGRSFIFAQRIFFVFVATECQRTSRSNERQVVQFRPPLCACLCGWFEVRQRDKLRTRYVGRDGGQQTSSTGQTASLQRRPGCLRLRPAAAAAAAAQLWGHPRCGPAALRVPRWSRQVVPCISLMSTVKTHTGK